MPTVALVGRPNVGKSTLFNRIVGERRALVAPEPGVTRDRIEGEATWRGAAFRVIDTGGVGLSVIEGAADLAEDVARQVAVALDSADTVVLVVDARAGLQPLDEEVAEALRRRGAAFVVAANKCDRPADAALAAEAARFGAPVFPLSAETGVGVDDLLDEIARRLPHSPATLGGEADGIRLAIVGRPNVGKSTLLNRLVGDARAVVAEAPGTTRDPVTARLETPHGIFRLVDTAGLRRPSRLRASGGGGRVRLERAAASKAIGEIGASDVAVLLLDPAEGATAEDRRIAALADRRGAGLVVAVGKWDAVGTRPGIDDPLAAMEADIRRRGGLFAHAPVVAVSGLTGRGLERLLAAAADVARRRAARHPTPAVNRIEALRAIEGPAGARVKYAAQVATAPPAFALHVGGGAGTLPPAFLRAAESALREALDLAGVPIRLVLKREARRSAA